MGLLSKRCLSYCLLGMAEVAARRRIKRKEQLIEDEGLVTLKHQARGSVERCACRSAPVCALPLPLDCCRHGHASCFAASITPSVSTPMLPETLCALCDFEGHFDPNPHVAPRQPHVWPHVFGSLAQAEAPTAVEPVVRYVVTMGT